MRGVVRRAIQFVIGLVAGTLLWMWGAPAYNALLAHATTPLIRIDHRLPGVDVVARGERIDVQSEHGLFPLVNIPATQLTFNLILVVALFASNPRPFGAANLKAFAISLAIVCLLHPVALIIAIESTYASRVPGWSETHYGSTAANAWLMAELVWRLAGMFAVPFACWWMAAEARQA